MRWQEAISKSKKGTAMRVVYFTENGFDLKKTFIMYKDGSGYMLLSDSVTRNVLHDKSRIATDRELLGYNDWEPSI